MKKIIFIFAIILGLVVVSNAQVVKAFTVDTLTNTESGALTTAKITGNYDAIFTVVVKQVSGTTAGTAFLQESIDGTNWSTIQTFAASADTLTLVTAATFSWVLTATPAMYYRIRLVQTGTSVSTYNGYYCLKPKMQAVIKP